jgi:8-oxo-dGTP diphosphatase
MTTIYLVRHAKAGDRDRWVGNDELRPLTKSGRQQAEALVGILADAGIGRVISSHYLRCTQTVEPLAAALGLQLETHEALVEGASLDATYELMRSIDRPAALCTHGDVMSELVLSLVEAGTPGADGPRWKKGSTWALELDGPKIGRARYIEPR